MFCVASYEKNEPNFLSLSDLGKVWGTSPCLVPTAWLLNVSHVGVAYRTACRASVSLFRDTYMAFVTCTWHHPGSQQLVSLDSLCVAVALLHSNSPSSGAPIQREWPVLGGSRGRYFGFLVISGCFRDITVSMTCHLQQDWITRFYNESWYLLSSATERGFSVRPDPGQRESEEVRLPDPPRVSDGVPAYR